MTTLNEWTPVLFTDISRFCVDFTERLVKVWKKSNTRFAPPSIAEQDLHDKRASYHGIGGCDYAE